MLRLLFLILLAYLVYRGIASLLRELRGAPGAGTFRPAPPRVTVTVHREPPKDTEELVACAHCGVRVPKSRTVTGEVCASCSDEPLR